MSGRVRRGDSSSQLGSIDLEKIDRIRSLWEECARYSAVEADDAMVCFLDGMGEVVGADAGYWAGAASDKEFQASQKSDLFDGYEAVGYLAMGGESRLDEVRDLQKMYEEVAKEHGVCPLAVAAMSDRGKTRGVTRRDVITDEAWEQHWIKRVFYDPNGIVDRFFAIAPVDKRSESCVVFDRWGDSPPFDASDRELLMLAVSGIGHLHRELMLNRGGVMNTKKLLTPREKDVLKTLLSGDTEKEIAETLGMGKSTLHHHILSIYRKFDVRNRSGLQALWGRGFTG